MKLILRFETKHGNGIYQDMDTSIAVEYDSQRHPLPEADSGLKEWRTNTGYERRQEYYFGFGNLTQARAWFYKGLWLEILERQDAELKVYQCQDDDVVVGFAQSVFVKREAVELLALPPTALHHPELVDTLVRLNAAVDNE